MGMVLFARHEAFNPIALDSLKKVFLCVHLAKRVGEMNQSTLEKK